MTTKRKNPYELPGITKIPPQATDLEEAVLGAIMLESESAAVISDILKAEHFYKEAHQEVYRAIMALYQRFQPIDLLTVANELKTTDKLGEVGGPYFLSQLTNRVASSANIEQHARIIIECYIKRQLGSTSGNISERSFDDSEDAFELLDEAERSIMEIGTQNTIKEPSRVIDIIRVVSKEIEGIAANPEKLTGIPSGFEEIDHITRGWQPTDLIVFAGRPSMGKTAWVMQAGSHAAMMAGKNVLVFSLEMSKEQLVKRMLGSETGIEHSRIREGKLTAGDWVNINTNITAMSSAKLYIDDTPAINVIQLRNKARRLKMKYGLDLIIVDYLQLMTSGLKNNSMNREGEISYISRSLKAIAKDLQVPVIALSQLSRKCEERPGKKPQLSDLRESGAIEQDADIVMFIFRPEYYSIPEYEDGMPTQGTAEINIAKHRNGELKEIRLKWEPAYTRFSRLEEMPMNDYGPMEAKF